MQPRHESVEHRFPGGKCFVVLRVVRDDDHIARVAATRSWGCVTLRGVLRSCDCEGWGWGLSSVRVSALSVRVYSAQHRVHRVALRRATSTPN